MLTQEPFCGRQHVRAAGAKGEEETTMFGHILVPLDGSELAECALPGAIQVAAATGATLHLVRVVEPPVAPGVNYLAASYALPMQGGRLVTAEDDPVTGESATAIAYLDALCLRTQAAGVPVQTEVRYGPVAAMLLDVERDAGIDLVVLCSHGRGGLARATRGSVADHLLRHGMAPVLFVRACGEPLTLRHAVVPLDGSARAEVALAVVDHLIPQVVQEVTLLHAIAAPERGPEAEHYLIDVSRHVKQGDRTTPHGEVVCWHDVARGDPAEAILAAAAPNKLVIMATHGRSGVARWVLGSVADRVARECPAGVLLVRAHSRDVGVPDIAEPRSR